MSPKVRNVLSQIDQVLMGLDVDAVALWDVLTALRGPDTPSLWSWKVKTTSRIRAAAFPETAIQDRTHYLLANFDARNYIAVPEPGSGGEGTEHFFRHMELAAAKLGLEVRWEREAQENVSEQ